MPLNGPTQILIADDDKEWREKISLPLENKGYQIHFASNYGEALGMIKGEIRFDLIYMNILLRERQDGWKLDWTNLLGEAKNRRLNVIVITSMNNDTSLEDIYKPALEYGVKAVFFKNKILREELLKKTEEIIPILGNGETRIYFLNAKEKEEIKQLVSDDQLEKALEALQSMKVYESEVTVKLGRLNRIKLQLRQRIISMEEADIQRTKIAYEILELISM